MAAALAIALLFSAKISKAEAQSSWPINSTQENAAPVFPACGFRYHYGDGCRKSGHDGCGANEGFIACDIVQDDPKNPSWSKTGMCTKSAYALETSFGCLQAASKSLLESVSIASLVESLYTNSVNGTCQWWDLHCKSLVSGAHSIGEIKPVTAANDCYAMGYRSTKCIGSAAVVNGCDLDSPFYSSGLDVHCAVDSKGLGTNAICSSAKQFGCQPGPPSSPTLFA